MPEVPVSMLEARLQKLIEKARLAVERGSFDYASGACAEVLAAAPGCVEVRRLQRAAELKRLASGSRWAARTLGKFSRAIAALNLRRLGPEAMVRASERTLATDPTSVAALERLAAAAAALGWRETVVFAREEICALQPRNGGARLALGSALVAAGRPAEARRIAEELLRAAPADAVARDLMQQASIAETVAAGNWEGAGSFRDKLRRKP